MNVCNEVISKSSDKIFNLCFQMTFSTKFREKEFSGIFIANNQSAAKSLHDVIGRT